jgi:hypothetical protein
LVFLAAAPKGLVRQFVGSLQTVVAVALFFLASLNSFTGSGWLAVSQLAGLVFNTSSRAVVWVCQCGKPRKSFVGC